MALKIKYLEKKSKFVSSQYIVWEGTTSNTSMFLICATYVLVFINAHEILNHCDLSLIIVLK